MLYAIALAVPAPHAPAALTGQEANTTRLAVPTSRAYGWSLDSRVYESLPGVFAGSRLPRHGSMVG